MHTALLDTAEFCCFLGMGREGDKRGLVRREDRKTREKELELDGENVCKSLCVCAFVRVGVLLFNYSF